MAEWRATYRLQLGPGLGFREARELVPYLRDLGISHLYLSPSLQAVHGSTHGYDVTDPTKISEDLGGEDAFRELCSAGLGVLLDIVPNHMATDAKENRFWGDPRRRRRFFDVDEELGWQRRFFTVDDLGGVRQEDPLVFAETHSKVFQLLDEGLVQGLRIDHPDGLVDPRGYLERLRERGAEHVWVEKILEPGEQLRDWAVEGTVGYEFANDVTALFVDPAAEEPLTRAYEERAGERRPFAQLAAEAKLELARTDFTPEFELLRTLVDDPGLEEAAASLHVYRTYVEPWCGRVEDADREALARLPERLCRILLLEEPGHHDFVCRFQQTTGPVMAKGVEDTAFYRWFRLSALNEVGGDPGRFHLPVEAFHRANAARARRFPRHMLTTQTHDTKRSGDVRARIVALTWVHEEWLRLRQGWRALDDPVEDELLWQTLVGAWPIERERLEAYLQKALREGKRTTGWIAPDEEHERAVRAAAGRVLEAPPPDFVPFAERVAELGRRISLGMTLLKLTVPGVPDVYQGDELEALSLVDPDNRRPVDWELRRRLLAEVRGGAAPTPETEKLHVVVRALELRARRPADFAGAYEPVEAGPGVCAFRRGDGVAVAVPLRREWDEEAAREALGPGRELLPGLPLLLVEREAS